MEDLISRQAAIAAIKNLYPGMPRVNFCYSQYKWREKNKEYIECEEIINKLPSVKPKKGKWIDIDSETYMWMIKCDQCGHLRSMMSTEGRYPKFCENCGADMRKGD